MPNANDGILNALAIQKDHRVCVAGTWPTLLQLLSGNCQLTQVNHQRQLDQLFNEQKQFDRVLLVSAPGIDTNDVEDVLVIRACQLLAEQGLVYFFTPVRAVGENFGKAVLKYYPTANVRGFNTTIGPVLVTAARGNPQEQK